MSINNIYKAFIVISTIIINVVIAHIFIFRNFIKYAIINIRFVIMFICGNIFILNCKLMNVLIDYFFKFHILFFANIIKNY